MNIPDLTPDGARALFDYLDGRADVDHRTLTDAKAALRAAQEAQAAQTAINVQRRRR